MLLLAGLAACSSTAPYSSNRDTLPPRAAANIAPHFPQTPYHCGPAALASVLQSAGVSVLPEQLTAHLYVPDRRGSFAIELKARARQFGMMAYRLPPDLDHLLAHLAEGVPVLVLQNLGLARWPQWHFAVAVGYDLPRGLILLHSANRDNLATDIALFAKTWQRADHWAIAVVPPDSPPAAAVTSRWIDAATELEQTGDAGAARAAYRAAIARWPAEPVAWFGLANTEYAMGRHRVAARALLHYLTLKPDDPAGTNNLEHVLRALDCASLQCPALER